ncbi:polysaccharide deacetylase [Natronococcus pandeyae]|uniref:Polysaccharide deacetylase n=1 Tax=Natronococcus pandeyae TaxID=2055836 RepID=A0A8J8TTK9_9EURY|nr:polysaccharide deacetylase family protein [Natronococcus pandeyae]TYL40029.1 polysaccharide deacetylase [Natronococcus pandeyae]
MQRRKLLSVTGITLAGGAATAYRLSRRPSDDDPDSSRVDDSQNDAKPDVSGDEGGDERTDSDDRTNSDDDDEQPQRDDEKSPPSIEDSEGMVVFTYDDSHIKDYTLTYRVHQEYDVPGCIAACPGTMLEQDDFLDPEHLLEMHEDGWSVMSHTYRHRVLGRIRLTEPAPRGADRIYVEWNEHGAIEDDPLVVFDEDSRVSASAAGRGSDSRGDYVELAEPLRESIDESGYVRYPQEFMREVLEKTDETLESWGIDVTGFVYTYDRYHGAVEDVVRDRYETVGNHRYGGGHNELDGLDPTTIRRLYIETDKSTEREIDSFMATAAEEDVLSVVGAHSFFETFDEERLRYTIESAIENDLAIVTIDEALAELGFQ